MVKCPKCHKVDIPEDSYLCDKCHENELRELNHMPPIEDDDHIGKGNFD